MSTNDPARRGFLRSLVTLPLIGGGLTLIGKPTSAAVPVTDQLLEHYDTWLFHERRRLRLERFGSKIEPTGVYRAGDLQVGTIIGRFDGAMIDLVRFNTASTFHDGPSASPITRAAVVLAAVGCDWREGGR